MSHTYGEQFDEAMSCETTEQAQAWLAREIEYYKTEYGKDATEAESIIKQNLGYMAGYYDDAAAKRVSRLFGAVHPIFGTDNYFNTVTPEQAFAAGAAAAAKRS